MLHHYHKNMAVGHHTAYEKAISVCSGQHQAEKLFYELGCERNDIEYVIAAYGLGMFLRHFGEHEIGTLLISGIISRESFWPCYSYLAAWQDNIP